jgi:hypothetical protein
MNVLAFDIGIKNLAFCNMALLTVSSSSSSLINLEREREREREREGETVTLEIEKEKEKEKEIEKEKDKNRKLHVLGWEVISLVPENSKVKKQSMDDTSATLYVELEKRWNNSWKNTVTTILIENQPAMKNPIMKSIQMLVYSFFVYKKILGGSVNIDIKFMSAMCKLKIGKHLTVDIQTKSKSSYIQNKKKAIAYTKHFLPLMCINEPEWSHVLTDRKKVDDACDTCLMCIYHFNDLKVVSVL